MSVRPIPHPDFVTAPYWEAAKAHVLRLPRCVNCRQVHAYPRPICPHCGHDGFDWAEMSGVGQVFSFTIVRRAPSPAFEALVPYVVAIVALSEGPHLMANIVDCDVDDVAIGDRVIVDYLDLASAEEIVGLPVFRRHSA
jgi:uncharacterized protein